jgi:hypothetical protein
MVVSWVNVEQAATAFQNCRNLITMPNVVTWTKVRNSSWLYTFYDCIKLTGNPFQLFPTTSVGRNLRLDPGEGYPLRTFGNCTLLTDYSTINTNWK